MVIQNITKIDVRGIRIIYTILHYHASVNSYHAPQGYVRVCVPAVIIKAKKHLINPLGDHVEIKIGSINAMRTIVCVCNDIGIWILFPAQAVV